jgi:aspartyl-tRNA(Asn)/glutamyl-tRNA(Gln) amidotransferase subunit A
LRLGVPRQALGGCEPAILRGLGLARAAAEADGAQVVEIDMAGWEPGRARRGALLLVEAEAAVALADLIDRPGALSDGLRAFLRYGRDLGPDRLAEGLARMRAARAAALRALAQVDMLLMPTAPQRAFAIVGAVPDSQADLTALANIAGLPALSLPVPLPGERLPGAVQLLGPAHSDERLLAFGERLEARLS